MLRRQSGLLLSSIAARHRFPVMPCLNRGGADPFCRNVSSLSNQPSLPSVELSRRRLALGDSLSDNVLSGGNSSLKSVSSLGLTLKCCHDHRKKALNDQRARTLSPFNQSVRHSKSPIEEINGRSATNAGLVNGHTVRQGGQPLGFSRISATNRVVVAVDVDEVLGNFVSALNRFIADRYSMNHSVSEYHVYEFFKIWNCSRDEADIRVHEFFKTTYFKNGIYPLPGAQQVLHKLSSLCKLSVVTSRQNVIKDHTVDWLDKHYPGLFHEIHFGNHFALQGESKPKSEICRSLGAELLIDDNPRYAMECAEAGIRVLLFDYENSYPWCKSDSVEQHPLVTKVYNWEQVEKHIVSLIAAP
ncbi:unnamed protein product [Linum trigynum]|uniref:Tac7077 n=1 Tax=Linum trigynum TaxID=586398 RepID=A0AAV2EVY3_9ROSI